jgi:carbamoyltransferase
LRPAGTCQKADDDGSFSESRDCCGDGYVSAYDLCATLQRAFERAVRTQLERRAPAGGTLYYAGGAALNIPTNRALQGHFGQLWVPPSTNDSGLALGAAAWIEYLDHGPLPRHGPFLNTFDCPAGEPATDDVPEVTAALLDGQVIGVCNGAGEVGPRALGHRSLLARADQVSIRRRLSEGIKRREWYRPVAPILCEAAARQVLEPDALNSALSRWMLGAWKVQPQWRRALQGVVHDDGSVRAQIVRPEDGNTWMHTLLETLWRDHGVPALINTSFNGPGKPIVQRHADALRVAGDLGLDGVVLHGSLHRP